MYSYAGTIEVLVLSDVTRVVFETEAEGLRYLRNHDPFIHGVMCQKSRHINAHLLAKLKYLKFIKYQDTRDVICISVRNRSCFCSHETYFIDHGASRDSAA
jgi:hypothetical protein